VGELLQAGETVEAQRQGFREVAAKLGGRNPSPSVRAARLVLDVIRARKGDVPAKSGASKATA
jgi:hypothetical protein